MCIGIPMQLLADGDGRALCEGRGQRETLDLMLVGEQPVGTWVLAFRGAAMRVMTADEARETDARARRARGRAGRRRQCRRPLRGSRRPRAQASRTPQGTSPMTIPMPLAAGAAATEYPLIAQLFAKHGFAEVTPANFDAWTQAAGPLAAALHRGSGPLQGNARSRGHRARTVRAFPGRFAVGVLLPDAAREFAVRYGFRRWPAFVMLADGQYVGAVDGLRNWDEYLAEVRRLLDAAPTRPPTIGIAVKGGARRCRRTVMRKSNGADMKDFPLPVRMVGSGSQPVEDEELQYLEMPRGMNTFRMPIVPERADAGALARSARPAGRVPRASSTAWDPAADRRGPHLDLAGVSPPALEIINQMLGEGEVSIQVGGDRTVPHPGERLHRAVARLCARRRRAARRRLARGRHAARLRRADGPRCRTRRAAARRPAGRRDEFAGAAGRDRQPDGDAVAAAIPRT